MTVLTGNVRNSIGVCVKGCDLKRFNVVAKEKEVEMKSAKPSPRPVINAAYEVGL